MLNKFKSLTKYILLGYFIYIVITAVVLFSFPSNHETYAEIATNDWVNEPSEKVVLIEDQLEALKVRFDMMNHAKETLDISYYSMHNGDMADLFFAHILMAADRGVNVRFLIDGIAHDFRHSQTDVIKLFTKHPNIELSFYEPLDILRPWTWNNRLHDKFIIVDQELALIGGRNIGDKYYRTDEERGFTRDRDVLLISTGNKKAQIIAQMQFYYDELWSHDYVDIQTDRNLTFIGERRANRAREKIKENYQGYLVTHPELFNGTVDWQERAHVVNRGFFVHNSIDRFFKEPRVWNQVLGLLNQAQEQIVIQSPYIIPNRSMREDLNRLDLSFDEGILLTNGMRSTPNVIAHSGYRNHRSWLAESDFNLYEYQKPKQSLHMKSIIIDQELMAVGSFNFDNRSVYLNTESMLILDSPSLAKETLKYIEDFYMPDSLIVSDTELNSQELAGVSVFKKINIFILRPITRLVEFLL